MAEWLWIPLGYFLGSVSSAVIVCKLSGLPDPRTTGSHNPGATNVLRVGGKKAAMVTLLGDMLKGLLPVAAANLMGADSLIVAATGLAAFLGHLFPIFFGFQGGKGVATALGVMLGMNWLLGLAVIGTWIAVAAISKISSLSALTAALLAPVYAMLILQQPLSAGLIAVMSGCLFWRHRENIRRLLRGEEPRMVG
ncbi:MAG TPA: glycerol-3-phosphate 1-O-acyltransferase [Methylothermaceae bacterium]|nr:glycerol-3-phosphate 1-O-acyltransferase [Methylothermaceae bacterium]